MQSELAIAVQAGIPVLAWGEPGIGKTAMVQQVARALGAKLHTVIAAIHEPSDFGMPQLVDGRLRTVAPAWAHELAEAASHGLAMLFLDELSCAAPAVQAACLRVVHERIVGDLDMGAVAMVAAANPPESAAGGWALARPLANRFCHLQVTPPSGADFADGLVSGWQDAAIPRLPELWTGLVLEMRIRIAAFCRARASVHSLPKTDDEIAWQSPRTYDMAATLLAAARSISATTCEHNLLAGCIGQGAAVELLEYEHALDLGDPEEYLRKPKSLVAKGMRSDRLFAILQSCVLAATTREPTEDRWHAGWRVLARAVDGEQADVGAAAARRLCAGYKSGWRLPSAELAAFEPILQAAGISRVGK